MWPMATILDRVRQGTLSSLKKVLLDSTNSEPFNTLVRSRLSTAPNAPMISHHSDENKTKTADLTTIYRQYVSGSPAMPPISFPPLTHLQPLASHLPSMLLLQGLCTCYSFALNTLPLNISRPTPSFHLDLCSNVSSPITTPSFWKKKKSHVLSFQFSCSLATYSALYFFTAPLTAWHSITYLFVYCLPLPLKPMLHEDEGFVALFTALSPCA